ncbi:DUF6612 family protein [Virgibacillus byunsanensis]|uniref:DUF6612 family protein n=1 Tax=Virgibacillus byunsanensis TaxID=570945 RepID=A0ABW3LK96_9BACI
MKRIIILLITTCLFLLVACSAGNDETENDVSSDEIQSNDQTQEQNDEEAAEEANEEENEDTEASGDPVVTEDVASILQKSAEAMAGVTSFKGVSDFIDDSTFNGTREKSETNFTMEIILSDPAVMHADMTSVSSETEEGSVEMFMKDGMLYINSEENWYSMPTDFGYGNLYEDYKMLEDDQIEQYVEHSNSFEVSDNGDHYLISFADDSENYKSVIMNSSFGAISDLFEEHYDNMEISSGTYEIKINKETFFMTQYTYEYEANTTGELGSIEQYSKGTYTLSDFNAYNEIDVPEEMMEKASPIGE